MTVTTPVEAFVMLFSEWEMNKKLDYLLKDEQGFSTCNQSTINYVSNDVIF